MASLKVESRDKNDGMDDGRYSAFEAKSGSDAGLFLSDLNENMFFVRVEARDKIADKWGVGFVRPGGVTVLECEVEHTSIQECKGAYSGGGAGLVEMPYFVRVE